LRVGEATLLRHSGEAVPSVVGARELGKTWIAREMGQRVKDFVDVLVIDGLSKIRFMLGHLARPARF
jgi:hypothetical protein